MTDADHGQTRAVRAGLESDTQHGAVVPPLYLSSNFTFAGYGDKRQYDYTRSGNPTRDALADALTTLEGGAGGVVTATGMASILLACQLLRPDDLLVVPHDCYGGSFRLFSNLAERGQFRVRFIDQTDPAALDAALAEGPRMIWVETPSNPLLRIVDIADVSARAKACGALVAVDNTFLSPALQQPIALGADIVVHSTTKYLNGHSDVVGGATIAATADLHETLADWANTLGLGGAPFDSYLTLRGVRTLHSRMRTHEANAHALVELLDSHPLVREVWYPGRAAHPGHEIAKRQQRGFGGMISFALDGGEAQVRAVLEGLRHFSLAESLGGVESLVCHPASMTHAPMDPGSRRAAGIGDTLVRLSVGIEHADDLVADLEQALDGAARLPEAVAATG